MVVESVSEMGVETTRKCMSTDRSDTESDDDSEFWGGSCDAIMVRRAMILRLRLSGPEKGESSFGSAKSVTNPTETKEKSLDFSEYPI